MKRVTYQGALDATTDPQLKHVLGAAIRAGVIDPEGSASDDPDYQKVIEALAKNWADEIDAEIIAEIIAGAKNWSKENDSMSAVDHPQHYNQGTLDEDGTAKYEPIKVIERLRLGFCAGNAVKYILRAPHKGKGLEDLEKALWYLNRRSDPVSDPIDGGGRYAIEAATDWALGHGLDDVMWLIGEHRFAAAAKALSAYLAVDP